jgi:hypothetical protein
VEIPHYIDTESIESHGLDHLEPMFPVLVRNSGIMNLGGIYTIRNGILMNRIVEAQWK